MEDVKKRALNWIRNGERWISSETIFDVLGWPIAEARYSFDTPQDASDFRRCYELISQIPEWRDRLPEVVKVHPHWKLIVDHWDELVSCLLIDMADGDGRSCYRLLNRLNRYSNAHLVL